MFTATIPRQVHTNRAEIVDAPSQQLPHPIFTN